MKLDYKRTILIGLAFASILAFWQFYDQVIPYLLESVFGVNTFWTNAIMSIDNILAIFMLPLFGVISDKTKTNMGKRTPYIFFGTIAAVSLLLFLSVFVTQVALPGFIVTLMLLLIVMAIYRSPCVAYMPDVTEKPLRSKANAIINLVGYIGGIFATVAMMFLLKSETLPDGTKSYNAEQSFVPIFCVIAGFMMVCVLVMYFTVKENSLPHVIDEEEKKEEENTTIDKGVKRSLIFILLSVFNWYAAYNAVSTAFSRYCVSVWNVDLGASSGYLTVATVVAIVAFVPLGFLSSAIGRKKMVIIGVILMIVGYGAAFFIREQSAIMYLLFAIAGIGWASINVNSFPMVVDMGSGSNVGKFTGIYYTFSMAAQIATPLLSGLLIELFGYKVLFPYAVAFSCLAFITMMFVKHGDSKPVKKKSAIEHFDVDG